MTILSIASGSRRRRIMEDNIESSTWQKAATNKETGVAVASRIAKHAFMATAAYSLTVETAPQPYTALIFAAVSLAAASEHAIIKDRLTNRAGEFNDFDRNASKLELGYQKALRLTVGLANEYNPIPCLRSAWNTLPEREGLLRNASNTVNRGCRALIRAMM
ncbi:MAG: hypothetical protein GW903_04100 [Alphaproteobacteria bacterium]|nr:hypothetical protein [Alphaproteobacteria bacterium]NCT05343.1 hypothetical protein [Alphaproteobacteria bacterium]